MALFTMIKTVLARGGNATKEYVHIVPEMAIPVGPAAKQPFDGLLKNSKALFAKQLPVTLNVSGYLDYGVMFSPVGGLALGKFLDVSFRSDMNRWVGSVLEWIKQEIPKKGTNFRDSFRKNDFEFCPVELKAMDGLDRGIGQAFLQALAFAAEMG
jgi:hypothetical protein